MSTSRVGVAVCGLLFAASATIGSAQTREQGPWWPSPHGAKDQAGNSNYITADKILKALRIPKTGQTYELGRIYEAEMPQYGYRPYFLTIIPAAAARKGRHRCGAAGLLHRFHRPVGHAVRRVRSSGKVVRMADGT